MSTTATLTKASEICVMTICADERTADAVREATVGRGTFAGTPEDYSVASGEVEALFKMENAELPVYVVDFDQDRALAIDTSRSLRAMVQGRGVVIAVSHQSAPELILDAMRAGCSEYLTKPVTAETVSEALSRLQYQASEVRGSKVKLGKILAFVGCRGGAGTTTLAVHLGTYLAQKFNQKTVIVDHHPHLGHVALYLGQDGSTNYHFYEVVRNVTRLDPTLLSGFVTHHSSGADVLASPGVLEDTTANLTLSAVERAIRFLAQVYDYVILDSQPGIGELNSATIDCCDEVYLITTPDVPACRDLSRFMDRLLRCNVSPSKIRIVVNRYSSDGAVSLEQIEKVVRQQISVTIPNSSTELITAMNSGTPISPDRKSEFAAAIRRWAGSLVPVTQQPTPLARRKFSFWK